MRVCKHDEGNDSTKYLEFVSARGAFRLAGMSFRLRSEVQFPAVSNLTSSRRYRVPTWRKSHQAGRVGTVLGPSQQEPNISNVAINHMQSAKLGQTVS
jgi:hypothetical protein